VSANVRRQGQRPCDEAIPAQAVVAPRTAIPFCIAPPKKMDAGSAAEFRVVCSAELSTGTAHAKKEAMVRGRWPGKANNSRKC